MPAHDVLPKEILRYGAYVCIGVEEEADVPTFHQVCASLRDVTKNAEWRFVREGPTWHGRRVPGWADLLGSSPS